MYEGLYGQHAIALLRTIVIKVSFCSWSPFSGFCSFVKVLKERRQIPEDLHNPDRSLQGNCQKPAAADPYLQTKLICEPSTFKSTI